MCLAFDKLSFAQVTKLHQRYSLFYDTWYSSVDQENADKGDMSELGDASLSIIEIMGNGGQAEQSKRDL